MRVYDETSSFKLHHLPVVRRRKQADGLRGRNVGSPPAANTRVQSCDDKPELTRLGRADPTTDLPKPD